MLLGSIVVVCITTPKSHSKAYRRTLFCVTNKERAQNQKRRKENFKSKTKSDIPQSLVIRYASKTPLINKLNTNERLLDSQKDFQGSRFYHSIHNFTIDAQLMRLQDPIAPHL